ncbi:hypothetical protein EXU57_07125 [Segetibacter sp. 3557_3]|uniref:hypothetical protein n=1 Tax=Segetibacter sp. 3557_3 TaxID=2547429 RepID=UPI001058E225|nr:hypothetical protein [Segetibacter sp. 3557_3]TDH27351.1 hypothetical protein EXU57_07125 [Segetibacter sp. 3557_3]
MAATLSILCFPQRWNNNQLTVRALVIPRNIDPTLPDQVGPGTPPWGEATMALRARFIADPEKYPSITEPDQQFAFAGIAMPPNVNQLLKQIADGLGGIRSTEKLQKASTTHRARKYLPESYRNSFNFTTPRTRDAAIDDSYHCAVKDNTPIDPTFKSSVDSLSWGKVFAFCLRQPALAERVGFVYETTFDIDPEQVKKGGWLYIDLADGCSFKAAMDADQKRVKRFAARIPKLKKGENRPVLAAIQFPVLVNVPPNPADEDVPVAPANMDELLVETEQYDDGFCKIVHADQPVSSDLLRENEDKELPVITDAGIRLAWDDEQLIIWMNRQLNEDTTLGAGRRNIAPMGVMQYRVDVRLQSDIVPNPNAWLPLCKVRNKANLAIGDTLIDKVDAEKELGVEVYPAQLDARKDQPFWLPQYYANWIGKSLVLPDTDAITIFQKDKNTVPDKQAKKFDQYAAAGLDGFQLLYGTKYEFRVRLADISGGGPMLEESRRYSSAAPEGRCDFRRTVQPQTVRLKNKLPEQDFVYFSDPEITMKRPLLGYPSVMFTGRYPNAVADLAADANAAILERREVGLPDPDVDAVEVLVEVKALEMDMLLRYDTDSRESYARLYITKRQFPDAGGFNDDLTIPLTFVDAPVLNFTDSQDLGTLGLVAGGDSIDSHNDIILPTSRDVRITIRPLVTNRDEYYAKNSSLPRKGKPVVIVTRSASHDETALFKPSADIDRIRGLWLQPDTDTYLKATLSEVFVENYQVTNTGSMMERLADSIGRIVPVEAKGLSLVGKPGTRIQFGASRPIRHNLSPDSTSFTFSTKSDLLNHWVVPITLLLNRDWTWDGAQPVSFKIFRKLKFVGAGLEAEDRNSIGWGPEVQVGDIEMKQAINVQALYNPDRSQTYLCYLDAVEPKSTDASKHPEEIMVSYRVQPRFKSVPVAVPVTTDPDLELVLHLPITTKPGQVPRIVSAGIAQSKYVSDPGYSSTEPRRRYLWLEFSEPLMNKNNAYFIRFLAYAPDPLLARWEFEMFRAPEEPSLPVSPEPMRIIGPNHTDDKSGLNAMQELTPADVSKVHFLVPLPPGLHPSSAELFGFFTYEIRVGHKRGWSTAQARFGSALRTTGVQHPAPQLFCIVNRNEKHIMVNAPYAQTVYNGEDVTSKPPRTELWALLYAQVKRADDKVFRNVLLDDQLFVRQRIPVNPTTGQQVIDINTDAVQYGITGWKNKDVIVLLQQYGLPVDSNLSVLVVEMLPTYDKFYSPPPANTAGSNSPRLSNRQVVKLEEGMEVQRFKSSVREVNAVATEKQAQLERNLQGRMEEQFINEAQKAERVRPLTDQLGSGRILRTSTLVPVPDICCTE